MEWLADGPSDPTNRRQLPQCFAGHAMKPRRTVHAAGVKVREMARATALDAGANRAERSSTFVRPLNRRLHRWAIFSGK